MNPVWVEWGPLVLRAYSVWIGGSILLALLIVAWRACCWSPAAVTRWLDVGLAALVGGLIGARALHVALEWDYFSGATAEMTRISAGGLAWHGALLGGIPAALLAARLRRVALRPWTDAAALAFPVIVIAAWLACRKVGCACGYEVRTLADWPEQVVHELPDVYGVVAPRLEVQLAGALLGIGLLALAVLLTWRGWLPGVRFWLILALAGLGFAVLGFFRADPAQMIAGRRADQVFDLLVFLLSTLTGSALWLLDRRSRGTPALASTQSPTEREQA